MKEYIERRVLWEAQYAVASRETVRGVAKKFKISKSTVHKDLTDRLFELDRKLYRKVRKVLDANLEVRHIRGGLATQAKYQNSSSEKS